MTTSTELDRQVREAVDDALPPGTARAHGDPLAAGALDSVAMVRLLSNLEAGFELTIPAEEITPDNFSSLRALAALIGRLRG